MKEERNVKDLRSQLKATPLKSLQKQIEEEDVAIGATSNEYLNLEDGKTVKIRIFPSHPGEENFYVPKKCYWITVTNNDGDPRRTTVLDSRLHGGTKWDVIEEYVKYAKRFCKGDAEKIEAITGQKDSLNPSYTWLCYADRVVEGEALRARLWEMKKMVRDALNRMAFSEDAEEAIEVDPYTDVDEGLPVNVTYRKNPNKKKGENFYEVAFSKKPKARPLTDEEVEYFMSLKPLSEIIGTYDVHMFEKALEGLQNFDEEHEIGLFEDEEWLAHLEEIRAQYDSDEEDDDDDDKKPSSKKTVAKKSESAKTTERKKETRREEPEDDDDEEVESTKDDDEEDDDEEEDVFDNMDRSELKAYIRDKELDIVVKKSMTDDDIRQAIREASKEEPEPEEPEAEELDDEEEDDEEEDVKPKVSLAQIRSKLGKK